MGLRRLWDHGLEAAVVALELRGAYLLPPGTLTEIIDTASRPMELLPASLPFCFTTSGSPRWTRRLISSASTVGHSAFGQGDHLASIAGHPIVPQILQLASLASQSLPRLVQKMARSLGVHPDTLSQWEQGARSPTIRSMELVAGILGLAKLNKDEEATRGGRVVRCREEYALHHG